MDQLPICLAGVNLFMDKAGVSASADDLHALLGLAVLRRDNGVQLPHRILHGVVDDKVIIGVGRLKLHFGPQQPLLDPSGRHSHRTAKR